MNKKLIDILNNILLENRINNLFCFSKTNFYKLTSHICIHIFSDFNRQEIARINYDSSMEEKTKSRKYLTMVRLNFAGTKIFLGYIIYSILSRIFNSGLEQVKDIHEDANYIFFSQLSGFLQFEFLKKSSLENFLICYLPSANNFNLKKKISWQKNDNVILIFPTFGLFKSLIKMFKYVNFLGPALEQRVSFLFGENKKPEMIAKMHEMIIRSIYYQNNAEKFALKIKRQFDKSVFVFDNDVFGFNFFLANELNLNRQKTVHVQHGSYVGNDLEFIPPVCRFMLCCSEREKKIQVDHGFEPLDLFVFGAPIQTISDSVCKEEVINKIEIDIIILGTSGPIYFLEECLNIIEVIKQFSDLRIVLRHRPGASRKEKSLWERKLCSAIVSKNKFLREDIQLSELVICCSLDAVISCLRNRKKTIFCSVPQHISEFEFLLDHSFVKVVSTKEGLIDAIKYFDSIPYSEYRKICDMKFVDENFGISDVHQITDNFQRILTSILNR